MIVLNILIAIPTFFILRWILKRYFKNSRKRVIATCIGTIVLTPLLYIGAIYIFFSILFHEPKRKFDKFSWNSDKTHRFQMADNIIKSKLLIGKDSTQVKALLGDTPVKYNNPTQHWSYDMGNGGGGLGFLFHNLSIKFKENKVTHVEHHQIAD